MSEKEFRWCENPRWSLLERLFRQERRHPQER